MMQEEKMTPPSTLENGIVNLGFFSEESLKASKAKKIAAQDIHYDTNQDETCGWLVLKPKFLQRFRTAKWVLFWLCLAATTQGMVINGFVNVCITTIEKRYNLKSASTGLIAGFYDIGCVLCTIPVSYLGSRHGASKPRWLGWGMLIMGFGSFVFALPHFASPYYELGSNGQDSTTSLLLCLKNSNKSVACHNNAQEWLSSFKHIFFLGQFLHGVGAVPLYTLGTTFLDESVPLKMSSLYLGIFHGMAVIGPAIGYVLGGRFLSIYIDSPSVDPAKFGITKDSDQWLGAWWIGFILAGCVAVVISWIGLSFPSSIPGGKERTAERIGASGDHPSTAPFGRMKDLPLAIKSLLTNLPFLFLCLAEAGEGLLLSGFSTFMPKVIESQFSVSAGFAALLVGILAVPAGGGGTLVGGWLVKRFQLQCTGIFKFCFILSFVCVLTCIGFTMSCPNIPFAGINTDYVNSPDVLAIPSLNAPCNNDCQCDDSMFDPVCGVNKLLYFSPCHAGCRDAHPRKAHQVFSQCDCILQSSLNISEPLKIQSSELDQVIYLERGSAVRQKCPSTCHLLASFLVLFFIVMFITFLISMPMVSGTLRCVPDTHRSFALGLQAIKVRVLGTIPGPIFFGYLIDNTCVHWQQTCDGTGACRSYDNSKMSRSILGVTLVFKTLSTIFFFLAWLAYKNRKSVKTETTNEIVQCSYISSANDNAAYDNT